MKTAAEIQEKIAGYAKEIERSREYVAALDPDKRGYRKEIESGQKRQILYSDRIWQLQWVLGEVN